MIRASAIVRPRSTAALRRNSQTQIPTAATIESTAKIRLLCGTSRMNPQSAPGL